MNQEDHDDYAAVSLRSVTKFELESFISYDSAHSGYRSKQNFKFFETYIRLSPLFIARPEFYH
jgi:hypothetical protein